MNYYDLMVFPITDTRHRLVGIITHDDVVDIIRDEATEDFHRFTGINPNEVSYLSGSLFSLIANRSGWVLVLLLLAGFSQDIIIRYGDLLEGNWIDLSLFFTVLVGVGGNVGSQSSILVIRGLATGEIVQNNMFRLIIRALISGLAMGVLLAGVLLLRIQIFQTGASVQWIAAIAMVLIVTVANLLGAVLPLILKHFKIDPAIVSAPLISTLMDVCGLIAYLEIARHML
jgi:magnesium transporter